MIQLLEHNKQRHPHLGPVDTAPPRQHPHFWELAPSKEDIALLSRRTRGAMSSEDFTKDIYLNTLIPKPWGHEYRIYIDNIYDVWRLKLSTGGQTSLHCHPRKDTALLCLSGTGLFQTLRQERTIRSGDYLYIRKGAFHSTRNESMEDLNLIEVECPRNKFDLVRMEDRYGRVNTSYEKSYETHTPLMDMRPVGIRCGALVRPRDLDGRYSFAVHRTKLGPQRASRIWSVNISMEAFLRNTMHVVHREEGNGVGTVSDAIFLSVYLNDNIKHKEKTNA
jgi:mannose-6-phosphate isomerase-like protein (cupin superfamily)